MQIEKEWAAIGTERASASQRRALYRWGVKPSIVKQMTSSEATAMLKLLSRVVEPEPEAKK